MLMKNLSIRERTYFALTVKYTDKCLVMNQADECYKCIRLFIAIK